MIVLDSSFLIAFHNSRDVHHEAAASVMDRLLQNEWGSGLLLDYVFLEVTTVLALRRNRAVAVSVGDTLLQARELELVAGSELFLDSYGTFRDQPGSGLSFVDAAIVTLARQRDTPYVATFDRDIRGLDGIAALPG